MESKVVASLDTLRSQLQQAESVLKTLDTELAQITCNPHEPRSVKRAIDRITTAIDNRFEGLRCNPVLGPLAEALKVQYIEGIEGRSLEAVPAGQ